MIVQTTIIYYIMQALIESHKTYPKTRETYTSPECRSQLYRGLGPPDAPALQDGTHLNIFTPEIIMFGTITQ